jgi:putative endonuclease
MAFWAYILRNPAGLFYIGQTENVDVRVFSHNRRDKIAGKFSRKNGPWELVWFEEHPDRASAMRRERQIKAWKSAKLIRGRLLGLTE